MTVTPADFPPVRWHGHWIWAEAPRPGSPFAWDSAPRPEAHGLFRKTFTLDQVPARVPARLTADSRYMLSVNGHWIGQGPGRAQPRRMSYDLHDLAPFLRPGGNVIAVHVKYYGKATSDWMPAVANGTLGKTGVLVFEADLGAAGWLVSDETWLSRLATGWTDGRDPGGMVVTAGIPVELFDARAEAPGWDQPGFDDTGWTPAHRIVPIHIGGRGLSQPPADPYGVLRPRLTGWPEGETRHPVRAEGATVPLPGDGGPAARAEAAARVATLSPLPLPATVTLAADSARLIRLDFGRIVAGFACLSLSAPAGTVIDLYYSEEPAHRPPEFGAAGGNRYIARGGRPEAHRVFDRKGFRYAHALIHGAAGEVALALTVEERNHPWSGTADFTCSDPDLTRLYQAARRTVQLNSTDAFTDCPTREQRAWVGDAVVHQMVHLATNADWRLARAYLDLGNSPRPDGILPMSVAGDVEQGAGFTIPDWSLHWLHGVRVLWQHEGDRDRIKELMPTAERILRWYLPYQGPSGLLEHVAEWNLVDWSALYSEGQSAIVNALWARGLRDFAELAEALGEAASAAWARGLWDRVHAAFDLFWHDGRGVYVDHAVAGVAQRPVNQLASSLAIVAGLCPADRMDRIIAAITDPARLVVRSWMFPGEDAPPEEHGERFRRMTQGGLVPDWDVEREIVIAEPFMSYVVHDAVAAAGHADKLPAMLRRWDEFLTDGYDTLGENWGVGTRVHGWSSCPARDLVAYVLGVTPAAPGFARARIAPRLGPLTHATGRVPTPFGEISVRVAGGKVSIDSPVPVTLDLPGQMPRDLAAGRHEV